MEDSSWGGLDSTIELRCLHGRAPRHMYCWEGKHTGRWFLGCPVKKKGDKCRFVQWMREEWPPRVQRVISTLWDMVGQFMEKTDRTQVDYMAAMAMRNEIFEEKEALILEKEDLERQRQALLREKEVLRRRV